MSPTKKMSLNDLKSMYPPASLHYVSPDGLEDRVGKHAASKKRHRHHIGGHRLGGFMTTSQMKSPAEYRRRHLGKKNKS